MIGSNRQRVPLKVQQLQLGQQRYGRQDVVVHEHVPAEVDLDERGHRLKAGQHLEAVVRHGQRQRPRLRVEKVGLNQLINSIDYVQESLRMGAILVKLGRKERELWRKNSHYLYLIKIDYIVFYYNRLNC